MLPRPIRVRRARRHDLIPVLEILAAVGAPLPPPDRATLRRFRRLVADLGSDLYVATADERVVGFVHVTYARQIASAARARIEVLAALPETAACAALLDLAATRARDRGCAEIAYLTDSPASAVAATLTASGWLNEHGLYRRRL